MVNIDLLEATMRRIEANPETHNQDDWYYRDECGTTFCFAGHAALLAGAPQPPEDEDNLYWRVSPLLLGDKLTIDDKICVENALGRDGLLPISIFASLALSLNSDQRHYLFTIAETPEELRKLVDLIKADPQISNSDLYDVFYEKDDD